MFIDESIINAQRRNLYVERIQRAITDIGVIDGHDAMALATDLVKSFDFALRHHLAEWSRVELRPQVAMGTADWIRVRGRVAEKSKVQMPQPDEEPFDILVSCWYRFLISNMPPTPILAKRGPREVLTATDEEGFFDMTLSARPDLGTYEGYLVELEVGEEATVRAEREICTVQVPPPDAERALLVDLDGILLEYPQNRFSQVLCELVLGQARRRILPLEGLSSLVTRLSNGNGVRTPIFYISNAPRHLYNHLSAAMMYAELPQGYLQLRDFDLRLRTLTTENTDVLEMLLAHEIVDHYPDLKFLFVGTTRRLKNYLTILRTMSHRLSGAYLLGEEDDVRETLEALRRDLPLHLVAADGPRLAEDAVARGWANG